MRQQERHLIFEKFLSIFLLPKFTNRLSTIVVPKSDSIFFVKLENT